MAEKRTINIDINSNASEAEKDFKSFNKAVDETTKSAKNLDATFEEVYGELQPLTTRMGEAEDRLYELALAGDTASKEYQELLTKVGEYRKVQIQTDLAVDGAATTMTQKLGGALNGVTSGFAATQGAMALFGDENEALEQSLLKVQSALAIQQGVQGLTESYRELGIGTKIAGAAQAAFTFVTGGASTALKLFRVALISTGVGALVVAVGLLVANFDKLLVPIQAAGQALKDFGDAIGLTSFAEADAAAQKQDADQQRLQMIKDIRASEAEAHKRRMAEREAERQASYNAAQDFNEILRLTGDANLANTLDRDLIADGFWFDRTRDLSDYTDEELKTYRKLLEFDKRLAEERKRNYEEYAAARISAARQIEDIENSLLIDGIEKELEINRDKFRRLREDAIANTKLTTTERATLIDLRNQQEAQAEAKIIADNQKRREDAFETERSERVELLNFVDELNTAEVESEKAKNLAIVQDNIETTKKNKDLIEEERQARLEAIQKGLEYAQQGADAIQQIGDLVFSNKMAKLEEGSKEEEELARKQFKFNKAMQLGGAIIDAGKAITASLASAPIAIGPVPNPAGIASLAFAATTSAVNIAKIASTKFESTGDPADTPTPNIDESAAPNFNVVGDSGINQIAQLQQQPVQAFVVSGEVTTSQALDRNRVQNATL